MKNNCIQNNKFVCLYQNLANDENRHNNKRENHRKICVMIKAILLSILLAITFYILLLVQLNENYMLSHLLHLNSCPFKIASSIIVLLGIVIFSIWLYIGHIKHASKYIKYLFITLLVVMLIYFLLLLVNSLNNVNYRNSIIAVCLLMIISFWFFQKEFLLYGDPWINKGIIPSLKDIIQIDKCYNMGFIFFIILAITALQDIFKPNKYITSFLVVLAICSLLSEYMTSEYVGYDVQSFNSMSNLIKSINQLNKSIINKNRSTGVDKSITDKNIDEFYSNIVDFVDTLDTPLTGASQFSNRTFAAPSFQMFILQFWDSQESNNQSAHKNQCEISPQNDCPHLNNPILNQKFQDIIGTPDNNKQKAYMNIYKENRAILDAHKNIECYNDSFYKLINEIKNEVLSVTRAKRIID